MDNLSEEEFERLLIESFGVNSNCVECETRYGWDGCEENRKFACDLQEFWDREDTRDEYSIRRFRRKE